MWLAYNTNGLAHHRLDEACRLLADLGYAGVAITPDVAHLDPFRTTERDWEAARGELDRLKLACVLETGARYLLDPKLKHRPNLCSRSGSDRRLEFYVRCCRMAKVLGARGVSIWSGPLDPGDSAEAAFPRLVEGLKRLLDRAAGEGVRICFEPEPGMLVDSLERYRELRRCLGRDDLLTTIDLGHLIVTEPGAPEAHLAEWKDSLINVQVDDARRGVHEHLAPGQGEISFPPIFRELRRLNYAGPLAMELSRDSHRGAEAAAEAIRVVGPMLKG
jgi:sugar phosphate isomerase/epimerase